MASVAYSHESVLSITLSLYGFARVGTSACTKLSAGAKKIAHVVKCQIGYG